MKHALDGLPCSSSEFKLKLFETLNFNFYYQEIIHIGANLQTIINTNCDFISCVNYDPDFNHIIKS